MKLPNRARDTQIMQPQVEYAAIWQ